MCANLDELASRARGGCVESRNRLVVACAGLLHRLAFRYSSGIADKDDLVQDGAIKLMDAVHTWKPERGKFVTWAWNVVRWSHMEARRQECAMVSLDSQDCGRDVPCEDRLDRRYKYSAGLTLAMRRLPFAWRSVLLMRCGLSRRCHGRRMSFIEIARRLGVSYSHARKIHIAAKNAIIAHLAGKPIRDTYGMESKFARRNGSREEIEAAYECATGP